VAAEAVRLGSGYLQTLYGRATPAAPTVLLMGITSKCNLRCDFCFHGGNDIPAEHQRAKGVMRYELFTSIIEQARGWCAHLDFDLFGEPMMHPRFIDMVRLAVEADLAVAIYTNGTFLTPTRARELVDAGPASVTVSMDGSSPEEYERLRAGASWERVSHNLRGLVEARRVLGRRCPLIVVRGIALAGHGAEERRAHEALYRDLGVDQVMWVPPRNWSGSLTAAQGSIRLPPPPPRTQRCDFPRAALAIDWDGTVLPCCEDFNAKNPLGDVNVTPLREIWGGAPIESLRRALATCDREHINATTGCAGCGNLSQPLMPLRYRLQLVRMIAGEFRARLTDG